MKHRKIAVASPWSNGMVERVNRFLKSSLIRTIKSIDEWKNEIGAVQYTINNSHHASIKSTPAKLMLGFDQRSHADFRFSVFTCELVEIDKNIEKERERRFANACWKRRNPKI